MDDDKRMNVACSRAKKVFWILGGDCSDGSRKIKTPAYIKYYQHLKTKGRVLNMNNAIIQEGGSSWMYALEKKEVNLTVRWKTEPLKGEVHLGEAAKGNESVTADQQITEAVAALGV